MKLFLNHLQRPNENRSNKILPMCDHTRRSSLGRLSTFSTMAVDDAQRISTVRLAGSGCVFNPDNVYLDCIGCGKITMLADGMIIRYAISTNINKRLKQPAN